MVRPGNRARKKIVDRSIRIAGGLLATGLLAFTVPAQAADEEPYPCDIEVVIHSKYGGGTDTTARMMMIRSRRNLGVEMDVVSKRGGSGATAQNYVMSKPADGCTIMALTQTHLYTIAREKSDMKIDDLVGIVRAMDDPTFIAVNQDSEHQSLEDLVKASKESAQNWGVAQIGGTEHVGLALFAKAAGIEYKPVAMGSGLQMVQGLMSGAVEATLPNVSEAKEQIADGALRPLAVMAKKRLADFPDVPTTFELGYEVTTSTTRGYAVRAGTPPERVEQLSDALQKAMMHDTFASYLKGAGLNPDDSVAGSDTWTAHLKEEYEKAVQALSELGISTEG